MEAYRRRITPVLLAAAAMVPAAAQVVEPCPVPDTRPSAVAAPQGSYVATLGDQDIQFQNAPVMIGTETLVPLRESLTAIGAQNIQYVQSANQVTFTLQDKQGVVSLSNGSMTLGGNPVSSATGVRVIGGVSYVPATSVASLDSRFQVRRVLVAGFRGSAPIPAENTQRTFTFNGQTHTYSSPTWVTGANGELMVPVGETVSAMGAGPLNFPEGAIQGSFTYNGRNVVLNVQSGYAQIDNQAFPMDAPAVVRGGILYVPASFFQCLDSRFGIPG